MLKDYQPFLIFRDQRSQYQQIPTPKHQTFETFLQKQPRYKVSQTKNIILNFRSIFKKIINDNKELSDNTKKIILKIMNANTNIQMIKNLLRNIQFKSLMKKMVDQGTFQKYIFQSKMFISNKLYCIKYFNSLLNAIQDLQSLKRWVPFKQFPGLMNFRKVYDLQSKQEQSQSTQLNQSRESSLQKEQCQGNWVKNLMKQQDLDIHSQQLNIQTQLDFDKNNYELSSNMFEEPGSEFLNLEKIESIYQNCDQY